MLNVAPSVSTAPSKITFYPQFVAITGCHASAVVLSQIVYWSTGKLRVKRKGQYWLAKSRADMCRETGISLDQYKRIMPLLVAKGLIVSERGLFQNRVTPHHRLTALAYALLESPASNPLVAHPTIQLVAKPANQLGVNATNLPTGITTGITTKELAQTPEQGGEKNKQNDQGKTGLRSEKHSLQRVDKRMDVKDILEKRKKGQASNNKSSLSSFWLRHRSEVVEGFQKPLTQKEKGQLNHLKKLLGEETREVIATVTRDWWKFGNRVAASKGTGFPGDPQIGFLVANADVALNLLHEGQKKTSAVQSTAQKPVATVMAAVEQEIPHQMTDEEFEVMMESLKE